MIGCYEMEANAFTCLHQLIFRATTAYCKVYHEVYGPVPKFV